MQTVSDEWKLNQQQDFVDESFLEISMDMSVPYVLDNASANSNRADAMSQTSKVVDLQKRGMGYYNTLEQNCWILDGSGQNTSTSTQANSNGYVSRDICDGNGNFFEGSCPTLSIVVDRSGFTDDFPEIPGITIVWGDYESTYRKEVKEYATRYKVQLFRNGVGSDIRERVNSSVETKFNFIEQNDNPNDDINFTNYNEIEISVLSWSLPYRRAKISKVYLGEVVVYGKDEIMSFTSTQEAERYGTALSKSEITFSIDNLDRKFDPLNPKGWFKYLARRQCVTTRYGFKIGNTIEWIKGGTYFLSEWECPQNSIEATFTARDVFEFLTDIYDEGTYSGTAVPLASLARALLSKVNIPQMRFVIERNILNSVKWGVYSLEGTHAPLPVASIAECLQLISNFASCQIYQNRDGQLTTYYEPDHNVSSTDYIVNNNNCYSAPNITLDKEISRVDVNSYNYTPSDEASEIYNGTVSLVSGTQDIVLSYSSPIAVDYTNTIAITAPTGVTVTVNEDKKFSYVRKLNITSSATATVTIVVMGKKLNVSKTVVTYPKNVTNDGEVLTADNELITNYSGAFYLGESIYGEHKQRMLVSAEFRADPRLDVLDGIKFENDRYDTNMYVRTTSVKLTYNGAFRGEIEGRQAR